MTIRLMQKQVYMFRLPTHNYVFHNQLPSFLRRGGFTLTKLREEHYDKPSSPETCFYVSIAHHYFYVIFLNKLLEFQDKVVNKNKVL